MIVRIYSVENKPCRNYTIFNFRIKTGAEVVNNCK